MGFLSLLEVASMPVIQVLLISILGAFLATDYCNILHANATNSLNKIVFVVFTPALMFANLSETVTLEDIISWWFMPVNIGLTFLIGGILGWLLVKILRPRPHLEGLIIATCSAGNMGNLPLILVPAICNEDGSPFGDRNTCRSIGLSYASFSMALGGFYIWTYTYQLVKGSAMKFKALEASENLPNNDLDADQETQLLKADGDAQRETPQDLEKQPQTKSGLSGETVDEHKVSSWRAVAGFLKQILEELSAPPTLGAMVGFIFGATKWLRNLVVGDDAPLRVIQDSAQILGDGTIPSITLILGGNLIQGFRSSAIKPSIMAGVVFARYIILPAIGIGIVKAAENLGFLPADPLFQYVLLLQYTVPPAMSIGTITQLFNVGQDECSVLLMWTYLVAAFALTVWSTVFLSLLS